MIEGKPLMSRTSETYTAQLPIPTQKSSQSCLARRNSRYMGLSVVLQRA